MSELKELLLPALRQYQHNDYSGLLFGYDKDEVESIVDNLREQLAKVNERVEELELIIVAITHADETGYVEDVGFVKGWSEVCDEAKQLLNKFSLEKKIEALNDLKVKAVESIHRNWIVNPMNNVESPGVDELMKQSVGLNTTMIDLEIEQLRKEQSSD